MSKFCKRHYEAIAEVLQSASPIQADNAYSIRLDQHNETVSHFANMLARDNGLFKRGRFERACVPGANVRARS
jgi:hypothetical protein